MEVTKINLKKCDIFLDLALDRSDWEIDFMPQHIWDKEALMLMMMFKTERSPKILLNY